MAGFFSPSLGFTSTIGSFVGGFARGMNENAIADAERQHQDDVLSQAWAAKADKGIQKRNEENKALMKDVDKYREFYQMTEGNDWAATIAMNMYRSNPKSYHEIIRQLGALKDTKAPQGFDPNSFMKEIQDKVSTNNIASNAALSRTGKYRNAVTSPYTPPNLNIMQQQANQTKQPQPLNYGQSVKPQQQITPLPNIPDYSQAFQAPDNQQQGFAEGGIYDDENQQLPIQDASQSFQPTMTDANNDLNNTQSGQQLAQNSIPQFLPSPQEDLRRKQQQNLDSEIVHRKAMEDLTKSQRDIEKQRLDFERQKYLDNPNTNVYKPGEAADQDYLKEKNNGLADRFANLKSAQQQLADTQLLQDALDRGFNANRGQDVIDNLNRFTKPVLGIDLTPLGANPINDVNTVKKGISATILNQLKTYHFGRILEKEVALTENSIMNSGADSNTNVKILLLTKSAVQAQIEGVQKEYNAAFLNGKTVTPESIANARKIYQDSMNNILTDVLPWQKAANNEAAVEKVLKNAPVGSWIENTDNGHMFQVMPNGSLRPADKSIRR